MGRSSIIMYSLNGAYPIKTLPHRIRLSDGRTRTDSSTFTDEEIADAGYSIVEVVVGTGEYEKLVWNGTSFDVVAFTQEEIDKYHKELWDEIMFQKDIKLKETVWRVDRHDSEVRLGLTPTDDIDDIGLINEYITSLNSIDIPDPIVDPRTIENLMPTLNL